MPAASCLPAASVGLPFLRECCRRCCQSPAVASIGGAAHATAGRSADEKWLKDRKGRTLSAEDIAHYQKIVVALTETIRLMKEIDEVIDVHGGWPTAFQPATPSVVITG